MAAKKLLQCKMENEMNIDQLYLLENEILVLKFGAF